jgi:hypothetical protein
LFFGQHFFGGVFCARFLISTLRPLCFDCEQESFQIADKNLEQINFEA